ncbi:hypothetical protein Tco_0484483 [Tanacetum coccineum]
MCASLDMKSTTGGGQFLGSRLISWQCKKQTVVANSTSEAEYIAASHCCGQVLWIQNQINPVYHSKIKHIEIKHHFIRDSYEKRLIEMVKIHTDHNVADLLTKSCDVCKFIFQVASIGKRGQDTKIPFTLKKVGDEAVHKVLGDRIERAATTASSLEAEQDSGSGPRCQDTILGGVDAQTRFGTTSKSSNDPPISKVNTFGSGEDNITATARTSANGEVELTLTIDGQVKTITEASLRRHLKLEDNGGVTTLPNSEIFEQLALMGYVTDYDKLTFQKGHFSPQWRFLIHTILHCLSPKKTAWEQFSSNIATAIIFLATNRT